MLILVVGDLHIPHRKLSLPEQFLQLLKSGKVHKIFVTGNLCTPDQYSWLKSLCPDVNCVVVVGGDLDDKVQDPKETVVQTVVAFKIVRHPNGHQTLPLWGDPERRGSVGRELGVDILISGQTHVSSVANI
jgi:vacuolar protein sorting-associated protein 29